MKWRACRSLLATVGILGTLGLAGCAAVPSVPAQAAPQWRDEQFRPVALPPSESIMAVSEAMRRYLREEIAAQVRRRGALDGLLEALERQAQLRLDYDATSTRTAAEAFAARRGNCLSLTLMAAALARELGLRVGFRQVFTREPWARRDGMLIASGHVNIVLEPGVDAMARSAPARGVIVDFLPDADVRGYRAVDIDEATVLAMFMNNRAVESLAAGALDEAYAWSRRAIGQRPALTEAWNTLGVIYARRGLWDAAEAVFEHVLRHEADNVPALANLIGSLDRRGQATAAEPLRARLRQIEAVPPFAHFDQGVAALQAGDYRRASELLQRELDRNAGYAPAYFALALAQWRLGAEARALGLVQQALDFAANVGERDIYAAKLAWINNRRGARSLPK